MPTNAREPSIRRRVVRHAPGAAATGSCRSCSATDGRRRGDRQPTALSACRRSDAVQSTHVIAFWGPVLSFPPEGGSMRRTLRILLAALLTTVGGVAVAEPAAAALPDAHGFVLWNGAATVP